MVHGRVQSEKAGIIEGIIDVGIVVLAHFENPARIHAFNFLKPILLWKRKCLIPTSATMGAYHIMTEYLGVDRLSACKALTKTLETKSPAFYEDISVDMVTDALEYALAYKIESWDGYIVSLAKNHGAVIIYSIDGELAKRVKDVEVINPIPGDVMRKYHDFVAEIRE
jgi:predicted nucleic acid-binding protein